MDYVSIFKQLKDPSINNKEAVYLLYKTIYKEVESLINEGLSEKEIKETIQEEIINQLKEHNQNNLTDKLSSEGITNRNVEKAIDALLTDLDNDRLEDYSDFDNQILTLNLIGTLSDKNSEDSILKVLKNKLQNKLHQFTLLRNVIQKHKLEGKNVDLLNAFADIALIKKAGTNSLMNLHFNFAEAFLGDTEIINNSEDYFHNVIDYLFPAKEQTIIKNGIILEVKISTLADLEHRIKILKDNKNVMDLIGKMTEDTEVKNVILFCNNSLGKYEKEKSYPISLLTEDIGHLDNGVLYLNDSFDFNQFTKTALRLRVTKFLGTPANIKTAIYEYGTAIYLQELATNKSLKTQELISKLISVDKEDSKYYQEIISGFMTTIIASGNAIMDYIHKNYKGFNLVDCLARRDQRILNDNSRLVLDKIVLGFLDTFFERNKLTPSDVICVLRNTEGKSIYVPVSLKKIIGTKAKIVTCAEKMQRYSDKDNFTFKVKAKNNKSEKFSITIEVYKNNVADKIFLQISAADSFEAYYNKGKTRTDARAGKFNSKDNSIYRSFSTKENFLSVLRDKLRINPELDITFEQADIFQVLWDIYRRAIFSDRDYLLSFKEAEVCAKLSDYAGSKKDFIENINSGFIQEFLFNYVEINGEDL